MSGRRKHERFAPVQPWEGELRVLRDVIVHEAGPSEIVAVAHMPGVIGEVMMVDLAGGGYVASARVRVVESRPVILEGQVRHRVRLAVVDGNVRAELDEVAMRAH